jgi:hypothetical protein
MNWLESSMSEMRAEGGSWLSTMMLVPLWRIPRTTSIKAGAEVGASRLSEGFQQGPSTAPRCESARQWTRLRPIRTVGEVELEFTAQH